MKAIVIAVAMAVGMVAGGAAKAAGEEDLAKKSGCLNCHAVDTKKVGPAFKEVAAKFKGKSDADVYTAWKAAKVHASVKAPEDDVKKVIDWVLTLK